MIRVIFKATGQIGSIPEDKFDPNIFELADKPTQSPVQPIQQPVQPTQQSSNQQDFLSKVGGAGINILKSLLSPARFAAGGLVQAPVLAATGGKVNIPFLNKKELKKLSGKTFGERLGKSAKRSAKEDLKLASYAIPFGEGANLLTKTVLPGAVSAALFRAGEPGATPQNVAGAGITGAVTAPLLNKILGIGGKAEEIGQGLQKSITREGISRTVKAKPTSILQEEDLVQGLLDKGIKGNARQQRFQVANLFKDLSKKAEPILQKIKKTLSTNRFKSDITKTLTEEGDNFIPGDLTYERLLKRELTLLEKKSVNGRLGAKELFEFKNRLGSKLGNAFRKARGELQSPLTPTEGVRLDLWKVIDDKLINLGSVKNKSGKVISKIKDLTTEQSFLHQVSEGLKKASLEKVRIPVLGSRISAQPIQSAKANVGGISENVGSILNQILSPLKTKAGQKIQMPTLISILDNKNKPVVQDNIDNVLQQTGLEIKPPQSADTGQKITTEQLRKVLLSPQISSETKTTIKQLYDLQKTSASTQKRIYFIQLALEIYKQVASLALSAPAGGKGYLQAVSGQFPGVEGGSAEDLKRVTEGFAKAIAAAFAGEVGVATNEDIQRWLGLMPKPGDTRSERIRALKRLKSTIENDMKILGL